MKFKVPRQGADSRKACHPAQMLAQVRGGNLTPEDALARIRSVPKARVDLLPAVAGIMQEVRAALRRGDDPGLLAAAQFLFHLFEPTEEPSLLSLLSGVIGTLTCIAGDNMAGIPWLEEAVEWARASEESVLETSTLGDLANAYRNVGRLLDAQRVYQEAIEIAKHLKQEKLLLNHLNNLSIVYSDLGDFASQQTVLRRAWKLAVAVGSEEQKSGIQNNLGNLYRDHQDFKGAIIFYREALATAEKEQNDRLRAALLSNLGQSYTDMGDVDQAISYYKQGLEVAERTGSREVEASALVGLGQLYEENREFTIAQEFLERALEVSKMGKMPDIRMSALRALADFRVRWSQEPQTAIELLRQAVSMGESLREELKQPMQGERVQKRLSGVYSRLVQLYVESGQPNEAFIYSERARAALLLKELDRRTRKPGVPRSKYASLGHSGQHLPIMAIFNHLRRLGPSAVLVSYYVTDETIYTFILRADEEQVYCEQRPVNSQKLAQIQADFKREVPSHPAYGDIGESWLVLGEWVAEPLLPHLRTGDTLFLIPHGPLYNLPLHALTVAGQRLIENWPVAYLPSASALSPLMDPSPGTPDSPLVVGVHFTEEARGVARLLGDAGQTLIGDALDKTTVLEAMTNADLVHVSTYGFFSQREPERSGWLLHKSDTLDRYLTVRQEPGFARTIWDEIMSKTYEQTANEEIVSASDLASFRVPAKMVSLSACESGLVHTGPGDDPVGLVRGLLVAGVPAVVAALWLVHPDVTKRLMLAFYRYLSQSAPGWRYKPQALRLAMLDVMRDHPHPYYWAPFLLVGGVAPGVASSHAG